MNTPVEDDEMAHVSTNRTAGATLAEKIMNLRADWREAAEKRRVFRTTLNELSALSGRELADLGLHRSTIKAVAYEAAYGK